MISLLYSKVRYFSIVSLCLPSITSGHPHNTETTPSHLREIHHDIKLGKRYSQDIESQALLSKNREMIARVQRIGMELSEIANTHTISANWGDKQLNPFPHTFKVLQGKEVNAFSLPGGPIYVFEGLLNFAESDDEIAGVLSHEIAHTALRHVSMLQNKKSQYNSLAALPILILALATKGNAAASALGAGQLLGQALSSGWSLQAEHAADMGGIQYMLKSNYNPVGMLTFQERLCNHKIEIDWGIYNTHPPTKERVQATIEYLNKIDIPIRRSKVSTSLRVYSRSEPNSIDIEFLDRCLYSFTGQNAQQRAQQALECINHFFDQSPELFDIQLQKQNIILGYETKLIEITEEDAKLKGKSTDVLAQETLDNLKNALYKLKSRVHIKY